MKWVVRGRKLLIDISEKKSFSVDTTSIYMSIFHKQIIDIDGAQAPDIRVCLPKMKFSKIPAEPYLRVTRNETIELNLSIGVLVDGIYQPVNLDSDQIVIGNKWYPIDLVSIHSLRELLDKKSIPIGAPINLGQLICLRSLGDEINFLDDTELKFDDIANKPTASVNSIEGLNATLYSYQQAGIGFLQLISEQGIGCILADEMGLGKTLQIIGLLQIEKHNKRGQSMVVAPATLLENWRREFENFAPKLSVLIHAGAERAGITDSFTGLDVVIVSYDTVVRDEALLGMIQWNIVVLDEAQNIKNPEAQRTNIVKNMPRRVSIAVTGTPMENKLEDLWSLSDFALPGFLGTLKQFQSNFQNEYEDASRLAPMVAPVILKRHVKDVAKDLPEKIEIAQPIIMGKELSITYERVRLATIEKYGKAANMVATTKLRILCSHPSLGQQWDNDPAYGMSKYQRLIELLEEIFSRNEKVLVFSTYQGMVDLFLRDLALRWKNAYFNYIDGRVSVKDRQHIVDEFFDHSGHGALLLNPKAAGTGLNITAANHVIHYNPEWNPALTAQASGRAYRRKQTKPVTIHHLFFVDTVEEVIVQRSHHKEMLANNAVVGHDGKLTIPEIAMALQVSPIK